MYKQCECQESVERERLKKFCPWCGDPLKVELAATDSQHIKPNMPVFAEVKAAVEREVHGPLSSVEESIAFVVYNLIARHVGR